MDEFDDENSKMMYRDMDYGDLDDEEDYYDDEDLYGDEVSATSSQLRQEEAYIRSQAAAANRAQMMTYSGPGSKPLGAGSSLYGAGTMGGAGAFSAGGGAGAFSAGGGSGAFSAGGGAGAFSAGGGGT